MTYYETDKLLNSLIVTIGQRESNSWVAFSEDCTSNGRCITFDSCMYNGRLTHYLTLEEADNEIVLTLDEAYTWMQMLRFVSTYIWADRWLADDFVQEGYNAE